MKIFDFRARPRTKEFYRLVYPEIAPELKQYSKVFGFTGKAKDRYIPTSLEDSVAEMASYDIVNGVITAGNGVSNEEVFNVCREYGHVYSGLATINPTEGITNAYKQLKIAYYDYQLAGLSLSPYWLGIPPTDQKCYPLYALSEEANRIALIACSTHYNTKVSLEVSNPLLIDKLAVDFPSLKIVIGHAGLGFGMNSVTVAARHKNVYLEFSGLNPSYISPEIILAINTELRKQALFGTNFPLVGYDIIDKWKKFIKEENWHLFFYENTARLLNLPQS